jgi:hypothetical protein
MLSLERHYPRTGYFFFLNSNGCGFSALLPVKISIPPSKFGGLHAAVRSALEILMPRTELDVRRRGDATCVRTN